MLEHTLIDPLSDTRSRAEVASSLAERTSLTRDIAYLVVFFGFLFDASGLRYFLYKGVAHLKAPSV